LMPPPVVRRERCCCWGLPLLFDDDKPSSLPLADIAQY
jgi:hypothetical protein